jgi:hypothetical protein
VSHPPEGPDQAGKGTGPGPMRFVGLGAQLAGSLLVMVLLGEWADRKLSTGGVFTILGAAIAFAGTMISLVRALNQKDNAGR